METVVPGLIKIGKTGSENFETRMYQLERNGYSNVVGLKRRFAIEVEDYNEKETLIDEIFSKSRVLTSELFALDIDLVIQLLSSLDGKQIFPKTQTKEETFQEATRERSIKEDWALIPDGIYHLERNRKGFGKINASMKVEDGIFIVMAGSICAPAAAGWRPETVKTAPIKDNILQTDVICNSPTMAAWLATGQKTSGWRLWKDESGEIIDSYRKNK